MRTRYTVVNWKGDVIADHFYKDDAEANAERLSRLSGAPHRVEPYEAPDRTIVRNVNPKNDEGVTHDEN